MYKVIKRILLWIFRRLKIWQWGVLVSVFVLYGVMSYVPFANRFAQKTTNTFIADNDLYIQNLNIEGRKNANKQQVVQAVGLQNPTTSIFSINVYDIQNRLENLGWVKNAIVSRVYPNSLYVKISERTPVAILQKNKQISLMDMDGVYIAPSTDKFANLPVLIGEGVEQQVAPFFDLIKSDPTLQPIVTTATLVSKRRWDIILKGNILVKMPADDPEYAWALLGKLAREKDLLARPLEAIDLRIKGRVNLILKTEKKDKPI